MQWMTWKRALVGALLVAIAAPLTASDEFTDSQETEFTRDGAITITLSAGVHEIVRSEDAHIRVHWTVGDERDEVKARTTVDGRTAKVDVDGPSDDFHTVIEVPANSDLKLSLTAGVLTVRDIGGDRDIRLRAGELHIEVGDTDDYGKVAGSLWAGDINAGPFKQGASGLFRSIKWQGEGENDLQFKLYAGDVRLYSGKEQDG
jgi:hypothetical protein